MRQLDSVGPSLLSRFGRLDTLVHAAGALGKLTPAPHILPRDFGATVAVNLEASWRLIRSCGPLLLAAEAGRAVFVTDSLVDRPRAYWGLYGATKAAMHHLALSWAEEVRNTRCRVNLFDPGPVAHAPAGGGDAGRGCEPACRTRRRRRCDRRVMRGRVRGQCGGCPAPTVRPPPSGGGGGPSPPPSPT